MQLKVIDGAHAQVIDSDFSSEQADRTESDILEYLQMLTYVIFC